VPVRFVGESTAVTKLGGIMTHPRTEVHVTARAVDLPESVEVDLSSLVELHSAVHVSDLAASSKYTITDPPEEVLAIVLPPKVEVEELEAEAEEAAAAEAEGAEAPAEAETESASAGEEEEST